MKGVKLLVGIAAVVGMAGAWAGATVKYPVVLKDTYAYGSVSAVRNSSDTTQLIECTANIIADEAARQIQTNTSCYAVDKNGVEKMCSSSDPQFAQYALAITAASVIYFSWNENGGCTSINVDNGSSYLP